jgi:hypothetical protein
VAPAALITIFPEVAPKSDPSVALSRYVPEVSSTRLLKVATPFTAATLVVLPAANTPGPLLTASVTVDVSVVTTLPKKSSTATVTDGFSACPAVPVVGVCWYANILAVPAPTTMLPHVAGVSVPSVACRV